MRAMRAEQFSGYEGLKLIDLPEPAVSDGKVLLLMTAAGVTPLDHTILSGQFPPAKAPLVLGGDGTGVVEEGGAGSDAWNVIFTCFKLARSNRTSLRPCRWPKRLMLCVTWSRTASFGRVVLTM